jgi:hypothetical protein
MNIFETVKDGACHVSSESEFRELTEKINDLMVQENPCQGLALVSLTRFAIAVAAFKMDMNDDDMRSFFSEAVEDYIGVLIETEPAGSLS